MPRGSVSFRNRNGEIVMNTYTGTSATPLLSAIGRSWWVLLLFGIVAIVFGALAVSRPVVADDSGHRGFLTDSGRGSAAVW